MKSICVVLLVGTLLAGCATSSSTPTPTLPPSVETPSMLPDPTDPTQLIIVRPGEAFDLMLPSNASTGYHWAIIPELDLNVVEFVEQNYVAEEPVMPGSGGMDVWTFRAVNVGDATVVLGYYPPGNETDPDETVTFSIRVE